MSDTIAASAATTSTLALNSSTGSTIDVAGDQDWFSIVLSAGVTYTFRQDKASGSTLDSLLRVYDAGNVVRATDDDGGGNQNSLLSFTPSTSGTYYLAAGGYSNSTGAYALSATAPSTGGTSTGATDAIPGSAATTSTLALNSSTGSTIDVAGDQDWFSIVLSAGVTYTFRQDKASGSTLDSLLRVYDAGGVVRATDDDGGGNQNSLLSFTPSTSGAYYLAAGGYSNSTGAYALSATAASAVTVDTTAPTLLNSSPGDETVGIAASSNIVLAFNEPVRAGTGSITITNLTSGGGRTISSTDTSQVAFAGNTLTLNPNTDLSAGTRFEVTFGPGAVTDLAGNGFAGLPAGSLNFSTAAAAPAGDVIPGSAATTSTLALNSSTGSTIDVAGDQDWFSIVLSAGVTYTFRQDKASGSTLDSLLRVYDAGNVVRATDDDGGGNQNSLLSFTPSTSGTYYLAAGGYSNSTGAYGLSATASDTTAPTLLSLSPADEATGVSTSTNIVLTFSEPVRAGSGSLTITNLGNGVARSISTADTSQVTFAGSTLTLNPNTDLSAGTRFEVTVGAGAVRDLIGNSFAGLPAGTTQFATAATNAQPGRSAGDIFREAGRLNGDGDTFGIFDTGMIRVLADFSKAAYSLQPFERDSGSEQLINDVSPHADDARATLLNTQGWRPVDLPIPVSRMTLNTLSAPASMSLEFESSMANGHFAFGNAAAFVARSADSIVLAFRGTNDNDDGELDRIHPDKDQWGKPVDDSRQSMVDHFRLFDSMIAAFDAYVANPSNGITQVYVTGHSLGGAMALRYMSLHAGPLYEAVTFAAPPYVINAAGNRLDLRSNSQTDGRVVQVEIAQDPVPIGWDVGIDMPRMGHRVFLVGNQTLDSPDNFSVFDGDEANHSMDYYRQIAYSADNSAWGAVTASPGDKVVLVGGQRLGDEFVVDGRSLYLSNAGSQPLNSDDILRSDFNARLDHPISESRASQIYYGGQGSDSFIGSRGIDIMIGGVGGDNLTGGQGADILSGGGGPDLFIYTSGNDFGDRISGFVSGEDRIVWWEPTAGNGQLSLNFVAGTNPVARDVEPVMLYNTSTGALTIDGNGTGAGGQSLILTLVGAPLLAATDFFSINVLPGL